MLVFEYVLVLLAAVMLSNLINRFMPMLSAPILQIALGVLIAIIPFGAFGFEFELEPELFFVLFIAPLVFRASMVADKKTLWEMRGPIMGSAIALVVAMVLAVGYIVNALVPAIPLAAAFVLISALGPTDDVAVCAVGRRVAVPGKIMGILSGESIINDASGIVWFQFAVTAVVTGSFSITKAAWQLALVGLGGILVGLLSTSIKYALVKWLRSLGIENVTLHLLIGLLTPFVIYMAAESLAVSGILAVFASGIVHSFARDKLNPETVSLNIALDSVWSVLVFTFEGIVFVMLGTQLPGILKTIGGHAISGREIAGCVLLLALILAALRFAWWALAMQKKAYQDPDKPIGKIKSGVIFSLAGARGTVTLASVMSIPLLLSDGSAFPERDLIILLASGVIVVSLLITNFALPMLIERKDGQRKNGAEQAAYAEIIQKVTARLLLEATEDNRPAVGIVVRSYYERNAAPAGKDFFHTDEDRKLQVQALLWERENTAAMLEKGEIDEQVARHFVEILDVRRKSIDGSGGFIGGVAWFIKHLHRFKHFGGARHDANGFGRLLAANSLFVLQKLKETKGGGSANAVERLISAYEMIAAFHVGRRWGRGEANETDGAADSQVYEAAAKAFRIERGLIQEMFEAGRISRETAKEMRGNLAALEARLQPG
jgi:CPA1 family monovalent cation:H+ antiporter